MTAIHTYAVGDVHGRADLLEALLRSIVIEAALGGFEYKVVFLGDIIDRGPNSREAMQLVIDTMQDRAGSVLILGNHDWFPIRILDELECEQRDTALVHWITSMGGFMTVNSYGFDPYVFTVEDLSEMFPADHLELLRTASRYVEVDDYVLVHAGVKPSIPLPEQSAYDLMWITEPFLSSGGRLGKIVIHGHTVTQSRRPEWHADRIGVDTGAYETGRLSAVHIFPDGALEFLVSTSAGVDSIEPNVC